MLTKKDCKILIRSRSWKFMTASRPDKFSKELSVYYWNKKPVYYRPGSSDPHLIYNILLKKREKSEYWTPDEFKPEVILDIGGNIGISSIYLANRFPHSKIYTFEPIPENFRILSKNIENYSNIKAFCVALGKENGKFFINISDSHENFGGFSFYDLGVNKETRVEVAVRNVSDLLAENGISNVDFIKIDTEGAEFDIIRSFDENMISRVRWVLGELHGMNDFELLAYLSKWFDLEVRKNLGNRLFNFKAFNRVVSC